MNVTDHLKGLICEFCAKIFLSKQCFCVIKNKFIILEKLQNSRDGKKKKKKEMNKKKNFTDILPN